MVNCQGRFATAVNFGTLATLVGAVGTRIMRNREPVLAVIHPIIDNMLIIPFVLRYAYDVPLPIPLLMVTIGIGETISCGFLGLLLYKVLYEHARPAGKARRGLSDA